MTTRQQIEEATTGVDVEVQEVARPVGSHAERYADEGRINENIEAKERIGAILIVSYRSCPGRGREFPYLRVEITRGPGWVSQDT